MMNVDAFSGPTAVGGAQSSSSALLRPLPSPNDDRNPAIQKGKPGQNFAYDQSSAGADLRPLGRRQDHLVPAIAGRTTSDDPRGHLHHPSTAKGRTGRS